MLLYCLPLLSIIDNIEVCSAHIVTFVLDISFSDLSACRKIGERCSSEGHMFRF